MSGWRWMRREWSEWRDGERERGSDGDGPTGRARELETLILSFNPLERLPEEIGE